MRTRVLVMCAVVSTLISPSAQGGEFVVDEAWVIRSGKLKPIEDISEFVLRENGVGNVVSVGVGDDLKAGDVLTVKAGMNLKLKHGNDVRWMNYDTRVRVRGADLVTPLELQRGELLPDDGGGSAATEGGIAATFLKALGIGTQYYIRSGVEKDLVYVFDGEVHLFGAAGDTLKLGKGDAAEGTPEGLRPVELFEPDVVRIKKWREEVEWTGLTWFGKAIRFPARHPVLTTGALCAIASGVIVYQVGKDDSELTVQVVIP